MSFFPQSKIAASTIVVCGLVAVSTASVYSENNVVHGITLQHKRAASQAAASSTVEAVTPSDTDGHDNPEKVTYKTSANPRDVYAMNYHKTRPVKTDFFDWDQDLTNASLPVLNDLKFAWAALNTSSKLERKAQEYGSRFNFGINGSGCGVEEVRRLFRPVIGDSYVELEQLPEKVQIHLKDMSEPGKSMRYTLKNSFRDIRVSTEKFLRLTLIHAFRRESLYGAQYEAAIQNFLYLENGLNALKLRRVAGAEGYFRKTSAINYTIFSHEDSTYFFSLEESEPLLKVKKDKNYAGSKKIVQLREPGTSHTIVPIEMPTLQKMLFNMKKSPLNKKLGRKWPGDVLDYGAPEYGISARGVESKSDMYVRYLGTTSGGERKFMPVLPDIFDGRVRTPTNFLQEVEPVMKTILDVKSASGLNADVLAVKGTMLHRAISRIFEKPSSLIFDELLRSKGTSNWSTPTDAATTMSQKEATEKIAKSLRKNFRAYVLRNPESLRRIREDLMDSDDDDESDE